MVRVCGYDVVADRVSALRFVGYVPENPVAFQNLTVEELVRFIAALRGLREEDIEDVLEYYLEVFNLADKRGKLVSELSRGMVQKALVIAALIVRPRVLVMDEPMAGMDPEAQYVFKREVRRLVAEGATALISSHLLDVVERFCTRVGVIHRGRLILEGTVEEVKERIAEGRESSLEEIYLKLLGSRAVEA